MQLPRDLLQSLMLFYASVSSYSKRRQKSWQSHRDVTVHFCLCADLPANLRQEDGSREKYQHFFDEMDKDGSKTIEYAASIRLC